MRLAFAVAGPPGARNLVGGRGTGGGDAEFQKKCLGKMEDVAKEGRTVLFVSHNMASILNLCSKIHTSPEWSNFRIGNTNSVIILIVCIRLRMGNLILIVIGLPGQSHILRILEC